MPPNTVYVGRPSKWGNPFSRSFTPKDLQLKDEKDERQVCLDNYELWLRDKLKNNSHFLDELKGKDLACWCPLEKSCHADVLLKLLKEC